MIEFEIVGGVSAKAFYRNDHVVVKLNNSAEIAFFYDTETKSVSYITNRDIMNPDTLDELANYILLNYLDGIMFDLDIQETEYAEVYQQLQTGYK